MGTIAEKLEYLKQTKEAIAQALTGKGASVGEEDSFRSYAEKITGLQGAPTLAMYIIQPNDGLDGGMVEYTSQYGTTEYVYLETGKPIDFALFDRRYPVTFYLEKNGYNDVRYLNDYGTDPVRLPDEPGSTRVRYQFTEFGEAGNICRLALA